MNTEQSVTIAGTRCKKCERVSVPVQGFGCERCGAHGDDLVDVALSGHGRILEALAVHAHPQKLPVPFVLARVHLVEGPVINARLLDVAADSGAVRALSGKGVVAQHCTLDGPDLAFALEEKIA